MSSLARRACVIERMDDPACCPRRLLRTVDQFDAINRLVSRYRSILSRHVLADMERDPGRDHHLVDLGAGGCDIARWLLDAARRRGLRLRVTALDADPRIVEHARQRNLGVEGLHIARADALDAASVLASDYVFGNHFLHHLDDTAIRRLLGLWLPATRRALVFGDIERSAFSYAGFWLLGFAFRDSFAREDGLLSIRRGFRAHELAALADGLAAPVRVERWFPGRLALVVPPTRAQQPA